MVRKMLKMFILVLCKETLCTSVFGGMPFSLSPGVRICSVSPTPLPAPWQTPAAACLPHGLAPWAHRCTSSQTSQCQGNSPKPLVQLGSSFGSFPFRQALPCYQHLLSCPCHASPPVGSLQRRMQAPGAGPTAMMLNLLQSKEAGLAKTCYLHGMS